MRKQAQLVTAALLGVLIFACATNAAQRTPTSASDDAKIRSQMTDSVKAWNRGDLTGYLAVYDPRVTYITNDGPRPGVAAIEASFKDKFFMKGKPLQSLTYEHVAVRPLGPNTALATGRYVLAGGDKPQQTGWFSLVWSRGTQGWRVIHDHSD